MASSYYETRNRRAREVRSLTLPERKGGRVYLARELARGRREYPDDSHPRPRTRGECAGVPRPCPFVSCKENLYVDVKSNGNLICNFPDLEPHEMSASCALDESERGGLSWEQVGAAMNLTRARIEQIERNALIKLARSGAALREELER